MFFSQVDDFFDGERQFLLEYHSNLRDCTVRADKMTVLHKMLADNYIKLAQAVTDFASMEAAEAQRREASNDNFDAFLIKLAETMEKMRRIEGRVSTDQDLKLSDTLRYEK